jgi:hypothetical protein
VIVLSILPAVISFLRSRKGTPAQGKG